jgi:quercetin dioxygenase-like cupin family protein
MAKRAFVITGDGAAAIANDVADFRYRAAVHTLPVGDQTPVHVNRAAETQFMVEAGTVEFMVGGATGVVLAGDFVRVPPGLAHACRNIGDGPATILVRTTSPDAHKRAMRLSLSFAA